MQFYFFTGASPPGQIALTPLFFNFNYSMSHSLFIVLYIIIIQRHFSVCEKLLFIFGFVIMPQLIPFYFINQFSFSFLSLIALIFLFSSYILPLFTFQQVIRMFITKLSNKA
jgi:F-type H+-transporting ATPase subunit 8